MEPAWAWRVLGLAPGAAPGEVRHAFRTAAQLLHPDRVSDLSDDVRAEAHRRMVELADAYRICTALAAGAPPPPPRVARDDSAATDAGPLRAAGGQAATLLAEARRDLTDVRPWDAFRRGEPTPLDWDGNAALSRTVVARLEQVADAWPGTAEGDAARVLLVTSAAAANALSTRERAGHLVLVSDKTAQEEAWESLWGRDELAVAQVVYAHPTAADDLRRRATHRLAELDDWATLAADPDPDIRRNAAAHLLLQESRALAERAAWLSRRERAAFDAEHAAWRTRVDAVAEHLAASLRDDLVRADARIAEALTSRPKARV
jgi:hypothetical protein